MTLAQGGGSVKNGGEGQEGDGGREGTRRVAEVFADRDDLVERGLLWLQEADFVDEEARKRLWERYKRGDEATRAFLQEQVASVIGVTKDAPGTAPADPDDVDPLELEVLKQLSSPKVDLQEVVDQVGRFDPLRFLGDPKDPGPVMRFLSDAPLAVHRLRNRLLLAGSAFMVFVVGLMVLAVFVPAAVPYVGFAGVVLSAFAVGFFLLRSGFWIGRTAKKQGIDLRLYARLPDDERRVLFVRRIGLRVLDPKRVEWFMQRVQGLTPEEPMQAQGGPSAGRASTAESNGGASHPPPRNGAPGGSGAQEGPVKEAKRAAKKSAGAKQAAKPPAGRVERRGPKSSKRPTTKGDPGDKGNVTRKGQSKGARGSSASKGAGGRKRGRRSGGA